MAFTRKFLAALGVEADKIDEIIAAHTEVTEALKTQISEYKAENVKFAEVQAELKEVKKSLEAANKKIETAEKDDYKGKYEAVQAEYEVLKSDVKNEKIKSVKKSALSDKLKSLGYSDTATRLILRNGFADDIELDEKDNATNVDSVISNIQADSDFSGFTPKVTETEPHTPANPPANTGGKKVMTKSEIMAIKDTTERQAAIKAALESGNSDFN
jgi:hypothetical protein